MKKNKSKLVSVIMPVYNAENFLTQSIESILNQSYKNFEFIIIDDGSLDNSKKIIKNYLSDERIKFFSFKKKGIVSCLNFGIKISKGDYIARMDADDISHNDRLIKQVNFLNLKKKYDLVGSGAKYIGKISFFNKLICNSSEYCRSNIIFKNPFIHPSIMIRKKTFNYLKGYRKYFKSEDYELWSRFFDKYKGTNLKENLIKYRIHSDQHGFDDKDKTRESDIKKIQKKWIKKLGLNNSIKKTNFHYKLTTFNEKFEFDKNFGNYQKYLSWLLTLKNSNNKNLFDFESFNNFIYMYYLGITIAFSGHGVKTYQIFKNFEINKKKRIIDIIILLFCIFKIKNFYAKKLFWYLCQMKIVK